MTESIVLIQSGAFAMRVRAALRFRSRLTGLIGPRPFADCDALHIPRCRAIHTFGMRLKIDVLFVDSSRRIARICPALAPRRVRWCRSARDVWELPSGTLQTLKLRTGDLWPL